MNSVIEAEKRTIGTFARAVFLDERTTSGIAREWLRNRELFAGTSAEDAVVGLLNETVAYKTALETWSFPAANSDSRKGWGTTISVHGAPAGALCFDPGANECVEPAKSLLALLATWQRSPGTLLDFDLVERDTTMHGLRLSCFCGNEILDSYRLPHVTARCLARLVAETAHRGSAANSVTRETIRKAFKRFSETDVRSCVSVTGSVPPESFGTPVFSGASETIAEERIRAWKTSPRKFKETELRSWLAFLSSTCDCEDFGSLTRALVESSQRDEEMIALL